MRSNPNEEEVNAALRYACSNEFGVFQSSFLCQSISVVNPREPLCVSADTPLFEVVRLLKDCSSGCILVIDQEKKLEGIFSERDYLLKIACSKEEQIQSPIAQFMTRNPVSQQPDSSIAFVLNLMSQGGFRHIPLVDDEEHPIGIVSVKDILDHMVASFVDSLLNFETA